MKKYELIIEQAGDGYHGSVYVEDNLITDEAESINKLESSIKQAMEDIHGLKQSEIEFDHKYDLSALFTTFNYLKISSVAELAGLNAGLLRQYVSGVKYPSLQQAQKIEVALHKIAKELNQVHVYA